MIYKKNILSMEHTLIYRNFSNWGSIAHYEIYSRPCILQVVEETEQILWWYSMDQWWPFCSVSLLCNFEIQNLEKVALSMVYYNYLYWPPVSSWQYHKIVLHCIMICINTVDICGVLVDRKCKYEACINNIIWE